ncbi:pyridoxamine 5'-phosphate oxidase family protein [Halobaculum litoreum]|uniref:Pyridoxamine 5'-phosphate oxidase family protein n=1 Tax=Halobaculum litoreum TaxID=3031998 RepID=A0ABD5XLU9_9EURY|nr:pyridoxamine 5'-phosphate oxidase family protein [Halobaculum sp. DT92]
MDVIENSLSVALDAFLDRPLFCFVGTVAEGGDPRVSPLWYLWEDGRVWVLADTVGKSYPERVARTPETAVAVVDFDVRAGRVEHVGMRGRAAVVDHDADRAARLLERYLGPDRDAWDARFAELDPERWGLLRFTPETVVARDQSFSPSLG